MTFRPALLILETMLAMELYCKPSGNIVSPAPGQSAPAKTMFAPDAPLIWRPSVMKGVSGQVAP